MADLTWRERVIEVRRELEAVAEDAPEPVLDALLAEACHFTTAALRKQTEIAERRSMDDELRARARRLERDRLATTD